MKQYLVMAQAKDDNINIEFIGAHNTLEGAQAERDRCIEGDDKHNPCEYFIEKKDTPDYTFNDLFEEETYDAFGVNTKNSFNTPPKESK